MSDDASEPNDVLGTIFSVVWALFLTLFATQLVLTEIVAKLIVDDKKGQWKKTTGIITVRSHARSFCECVYSSHETLSQEGQCA